jgi:putative copper resistance protein D
MTGVLAAARAVHFASTILVFGELAFALFVAGSLWRESPVYRRWFNRVASWSIAASIASWLVWLGCEAVEMSGASLAQALSGQTLLLVLGRTEFGRLWLLRLALAAVLSVLLWPRARKPADAPYRALNLARFATAGAYLASLAWAGHAAAGSERGVQLTSDTLHLLAAGAWLGALPGLAALLRHVSSADVCAAAARRFSTLGVVSVSVLFVTGFVNAWYLVGDIPALVGTAYGELLLVKLALFATMLSLAAVNRFALTPRLSRGNAADAARIRRNALMETGTGVAIVAIVGVLGITVPGAHQSPVWPFSRGLDLEPAYPTSYASSPVPYTTRAIAHGAELYVQQCASCHGPHGHGDGPSAASLPVKPANLAEHAAFHRPGDLFWLVAHGVPGTPMPAFAAQLSDTRTWSVVRFLRALSDSETVNETAGATSLSQPIVAPDFVFQNAGQAQESLARPSQREMTLLVFYTLPQSLSRLRTLRAQTREYVEHAIRVIAIPIDDDSSGAQTTSGADFPRTLASPDVSAVYAMFARAPQGQAAAHVEFLIDARGFVRRRWLDMPGESTNRTAEILKEADAVAHAPPLTATEKSHAH